MRVDPANQHAVLLHQAEAGGGLASAGEYVRVACFAEESEQAVRFGRNSRASCQGVESYALPQKQVPYWASDSCAMLDGLEVITFFDVPFDPE